MMAGKSQRRTPCIQSLSKHVLRESGKRDWTVRGACPCCSTEMELLLLRLAWVLTARLAGALAARLAPVLAPVSTGAKQVVRVKSQNFSRGIGSGVIPQAARQSHRTPRS